MVSSPSAAPARESFRMGVRQALPIVLGYLPIGLSYGVVAQQSGLSPLEALLMSVIVYAGAAQFAASGMLAQGAALPSIVGATFLLNLRHLLFSAALAPRLAEKRVPRLALAAFWVTDEVFAVAQTAIDDAPRPIWYVWGLGLTAYSSWGAASFAGATIGQSLSGFGDLGLDYALPAMFLALLVLQLGSRHRAGTAVAIVAGLLSLGLRAIGWRDIHVLLATLAGAAVGMVLEWYGRKSSVSSS